MLALNFPFCVVQFKPTSPLSKEDPSYNNSPSVGDKVHCLVGVLSAERISLMEENNDIINKMREVREHASELGKYMPFCQ